MSKKEAVIFDLDGTLCLLDDPEDHHKGKHHEFSKMSTVAPVNHKMREKALDYHEEGYKVIILTARSSHYRSETVKWLAKHDIDYDLLIMRDKTDARPDAVVKEDLLETRVLPLYKVKVAYDDRKKNRKMYKKHDIKAKDEK